MDANLQSLDFTPLPACPSAPLVVFVHGGGWTVGDKRSGAGQKAQFFNQAGYAFASVNYRLRPDAQVQDSVEDIAHAVGFLRKMAGDWGYHPDKIVLMGHSAGAHLAALVTLDPQYFSQAGVPPASIRAVSLLDGAGYDIPLQVRTGGNSELYTSVFGADNVQWEKFSPLNYVEVATEPPPFILHHVDGRAASALQAQKLASALQARGVAAVVKAAMGKTHASLNKQFGEMGDVPSIEVLEFLRRHVPSQCGGPA